MKRYGEYQKFSTNTGSNKSVPQDGYQTLKKADRTMYMGPSYPWGDRGDMDLKNDDPAQLYDVGGDAIDEGDDYG